MPKLLLRSKGVENYFPNEGCLTHSVGLIYGGGISEEKEVSHRSEHAKNYRDNVRLFMIKGVANC